MSIEHVDEWSCLDGNEREKKQKGLGIGRGVTRATTKTYLSCSVAWCSGNSGFRCSFGYQYGYNGLEPLQRLKMHFT